MADVTKPDPNLPVAVAKETKWSLVAIGGVLLVLFAALLVFDRAVGSETKEKTTPASQESGATGSSGSQPTASEKTTEKKDLPSDTLLTAILASGAALILAGVLYGRISTIKLPGGVQIDLTKEEKDAVAQQVAERMPNADPKEIAQVTQLATTEIQQLKASGQMATPEQKIGEIVADLAPSP